MIAAMPRFAVIIHDLGHARAALAAAADMGVAVELWSAPGAAAYAGAGWFDALVRLARQDHPDADVQAVLDCGSRADLAQAALRQGLRGICFHGSKAAAARLADIAAQHDATLHRRRPNTLDLLDAAEPFDACRTWFGGD